MPHSRRATGPLIAAAVWLLVLVPAVGWLAAEWGRDKALAGLQREAEAQLALYATNLRRQLEKYGSVPYVLARDPEVAEALLHPRDAGAVARLNQKLEEINATFQTSALYVMDRDGTAIAASNWNTATSFVGENYAYRPYFKGAVSGGVGRYFAHGRSSGVPGYYVAFPVRVETRVAGVVVIKIGIDNIEDGWKEAGDGLIVTDRHGIVFITSVEGWRYRSLTPLPEATLAGVRDSRQYGDNEIVPLEVGERRPAGEGSELVRLAVPRRFGASVDNGYLHQWMPLAEFGWQLHGLFDAGPMARAAGLSASTAVLTALTIGSALFVVWQRRTALQARVAAERLAKIELERRVEERTFELTIANRGLERAIEERMRAEGELIQAAKLAAIGQMSASISHEINQPLAAIRTYADNGRVLLERGKLETVAANLSGIAGLTERIARITSQLKTFARRPSDELRPIQLERVVSEALGLVGPQLRQWRITVADGTVECGLCILAETVRIEQVLVNLFRNAIDAMRDAPLRRLDISAERDGGEAVLRVRDTGTGIAETALPQLFDPFFTTKTEGEGLGLGLSVSYGIVKAFGGSITAGNHREGGAEFVLRLPLSEKVTA